MGMGMADDVAKRHATIASRIVLDSILIEMVALFCQCENERYSKRRVVRRPTWSGRDYRVKRLSGKSRDGQGEVLTSERWKGDGSGKKGLVWER